MTTHLPWLILFAPLLSAAVITLFTQRLRNVSAMISVAAVLVSFLGTCALFAKAEPISVPSLQWLNLAEFKAPIGFTVDGLTKAMLVVVTGIGSLIHIYSLGYMEKEEGKSRYFAGLSLFMSSMLGIVFANNFVMMFIFWELVGVSSYVLIGHWFHRDAPPAAANKAFITNRIGDFGFMLGILMVWLATGSVVFNDIHANLGALTANPAYLTIATLLVFCGAVGKSAQFPLHVWLPDAMEGPTPVSALIHAATMVAAGVYMLVRIGFLIEASHDAQTVIAWIGTITAVMAALMATQQSDIKRILAYSTLSQLGYMVMAVGITASDAAMFHLFTHAFFKALLFLGAGSVIHGMHHEQNIWKMGGLQSRMRVTFATFAIATAALTGFPFLSGFFSKDAILAAAYTHHPAIFWLALGTAFLTAFYMFRLVVVVFFGKARTDQATHSHESPGVMLAPLVILAIPSLIAGWPKIAGHFLRVPHEENGGFVTLLATGAFALGAALAWMLYAGKSQDPVRVPLFENKFYFDELYAGIIGWTQDLLAKAVGWFDRWILDGVAVRGASGGTWGTGFILRFLQMGNLQGYAFFFGIGAVALIYFILAR